MPATAAIAITNMNDSGKSDTVGIFESKAATAKVAAKIAAIIQPVRFVVKLKSYANLCILFLYPGLRTSAHGHTTPVTLTQEVPMDTEGTETEKRAKDALHHAEA